MNRQFAVRVSAALLLLGMFTSTKNAGAGVIAPDPWITGRVKMSLLLSQDVDGTKINVDTLDNNVTLHGTVPSESQKTAAGKIARQVVGVRSVRNLIAVVDEEWQDAVEIGDRAIERRLTALLRRDPRLEDSDIHIESVNKGVVVLGGRAATVSDLLYALRRIRSAEGVTSVASVVDSPDTPTDKEVWYQGNADDGSEGIWSASDVWITTAAKLRLMAHSQIPAFFNINVDTRDGVVTLFGMVPTEELKRAAKREVLKVDGVERVENDLQVVPITEQQSVARQDAEIKERVEQKFDDREALDDADIDVEVADGVVRLSGSVQTYTDRLKAVTMARVTDGVSSVVDDLNVQQR